MARHSSAQFAQVGENGVVASGVDIVRQFLPQSPFVAHLGMQLVALEPDRAEIAMPFAEALVTVGDTVHGGAIGALIDTTAMAAAWSGADVGAASRGTTVGYAVSFVAAARARDVKAVARVIKRGRSLTYLDVEVMDSDGQLVAKGLVTYKLD